MGEITEHDQKYLLSLTQGRIEDTNPTFESGDAQVLWTNYLKNLRNLQTHFKTVVEKQKIKRDV